MGKGIAGVVMCALLAGCATPMKTASGRPEVTITGKTTEQIRVAAVNQFINKGFQLRNADPLTMVFEKDAGIVASVFLGSPFNPQVVSRLRLNIIDLGNGTHRVVGIPFMVGNPGSGFEREHDMNGTYQATDYQLAVLKAVMEGGPMPAEPPREKTVSPRGTVPTQRGQ